MASARRRGAGRAARPGDRPIRSVPPYAAALPPPDVLSDEEELIAGRRPVEEAFVARREAHRLLVVPQRRQALEKLVLHATSLRIPIVEVEGGSLTALAGFDGHQGVALVVAPRRFASLEDILVRAAERGEPPFVLALDSLEDPQNVGTLLRSAEAAGVHGVLFPTRRQAPLTPSAVKASAGAVEHLLLCPVDDLAGALADLHARGLRVAGAEADAPLTARQSDLRGPLVVVVGSEGQGLGPAIRRRCDLFMRIPMRGAIGSLNAAVAGSILLFEAVAQRDPGGAALTRPTTARCRARAAKADATASAEGATNRRPSRPAKTEDGEATEGREGAEGREAAAEGREGAEDRARRRGEAPAKAASRPTARATTTAAKPKKVRTAPKPSQGGDRRRTATPARPTPRAPTTISSPAGRRRHHRKPRPRRPAAARPALDPLGRAALSFPGAGTGHLRYGPARRADVAQLVEQRFCKPPVPGSSPVVGSSDIIGTGSTMSPQLGPGPSRGSVEQRRLAWL